MITLHIKKTISINYHSRSQMILAIFFFEDLFIYLKSRERERKKGKKRREVWFLDGGLLYFRPWRPELIVKIHIWLRSGVGGQLCGTSGFAFSTYVLHVSSLLRCKKNPKAFLSPTEKQSHKHQGNMSLHSRKFAKRSATFDLCLYLQHPGSVWHW